MARVQLRSRPGAAGLSDSTLAYLTLEARARVRIDEMLAVAGWAVQDARSVNLSASRGVAVREFVLKPPHGRVDYLLYVDSEAVGVVEAKKEGETLTGVAWQTAKYVDGIPDEVPSALEGPLPFAYQSTGTETRFTNALDPSPASRDVFWLFKLFAAAAGVVAALGAASLTAAAAHAEIEAVPSVRIVSITSPVSRRSEATLVARVTPARALCSITIHYKSGPSRAGGTQPKRAVKGRVSWTWTVGSRTTGGVWPIYVQCGQAIAKTTFRVTG